MESRRRSRHTACDGAHPVTRQHALHTSAMTGGSVQMRRTVDRVLNSELLAPGGGGRGISCVTAGETQSVTSHKTGAFETESIIGGAIETGIDVVLALN